MITTDKKVSRRKDNKSLSCYREKQGELKYLYTLNNSGMASALTVWIMTARDILSLIQVTGLAGPAALSCGYSMPARFIDFQFCRAVRCFTHVQLSK